MAQQAETLPDTTEDTGSNPSPDKIYIYGTISVFFIALTKGESSVPPKRIDCFMFSYYESTSILKDFGLRFHQTLYKQYDSIGF